MRKRLFTRFTALFAAARFTVYTKRAASATPKFSFEPEYKPENPNISDEWLFASDEEIARHTQILSTEMDHIADSMADLRETLSLIAGDAPFPVEATTQKPCAIMQADPDLFDGEPLYVQPEQDTTIGEDNAMLFDEEEHHSHSLTDEARHAA